MWSYGKLPVTGLATLTVGGVVFDQARLVLVALAFVGVGAGLVRIGWRRSKPVDAR
jgi:hypothetical protein